MGQDEKRFITVEEAIGLLNDGDIIHTFRNPGANTLVGFDSSRKFVLDAIVTYSDTLQIGGVQCRKMKHGLVVKDDISWLFIETNEEKLNAFDPIE